MKIWNPFKQEPHLSQSAVLTLGLLMGFILSLFMLITVSVYRNNDSTRYVTDLDGFNFKLDKSKRIESIFMRRYDGTTTVVPRNLIGDIIVEIKSKPSGLPQPNHYSP